MTHCYRNIARVVRPHGKKGEVVVAPLLGLPFLLHVGMEVALTPPALDRNRFCKVISVDTHRNDPLVHFSGIDTISDAEAVQDCMVLAHEEDVKLDALVRPYEELLGRSVIDVRYGNLGTIQEIMTTSANDVWVVKGTAYGEVLIPVISDVVSTIPDFGPIKIGIMDGLIDAPVPNDNGASEC